VHYTRHRYLFTAPDGPRARSIKYRGTFTFREKQTDFICTWNLSRNNTASNLIKWSSSHRDGAFSLYNTTGGGALSVEREKNRSPRSRNHRRRQNRSRLLPNDRRRPRETAKTNRKKRISQRRSICGGIRAVLYRVRHRPGLGNC